MGRRNESGMKAQCTNPRCGYAWFYSGSQAVTSCPKCGWRVRVESAQRISTPQGDSLIGSRDNRGPLI